jgi:hypothetical protein
MNQTGLLHKTVTHEQLDILLVHLIQSIDLMQAACNKIRVQDFDESEFAHKLIWVTASDFYKTHKKLAPMDFLNTEVMYRLTMLPELNNTAIQQSITKKIKEYFAWEGGLIPSYALDILTSFLFERQVGTKLLEQASKGSMSKHIWEEIKLLERGASLDRAIEISPFSMNSGPLVGVKPRNPTGITFLDNMLGGGTRKGEVYGFLAASGNGKTTFGNQIAIAKAKDKKLTLVFSYEQPIDEEFLIPVYACATKIPRRVWECIRTPDDIPKVLTPVQYESYKTACGLIDQHLRFIDMSSSFHGPIEIDRKIAEIQERSGLQVDGIIIDWFWPMVSRAFGSLQGDRNKKYDLRTFAQGLIDEIKQIAISRNCWCWLNHQLNPDEAKKKRAMSFEDAAEVKSFAWYLNGCFCLDKLDEVEKIGTIHFSKARNQPNSKCSVQLKGEIATFMPLDKDLVWDKRQSKHVVRNEANVIPRANETKSRLQQSYEGTPVAGCVTGI